MADNDINKCQIEDVIRFLSTKWAARIIYILSEGGSLRFGQIKRAFEKKITSKSLSDKLALLVENDIICRKEVLGNVKEVYYETTNKGEAVHKALKQLESSFTA